MVPSGLPHFPVQSRSNTASLSGFDRPSGNRVPEDRKTEVSPIAKFQKFAAAFVVAALPFIAGPAAAESYPTDELYQPGKLPEKVLGNPDAKVTVVEYASLTCGHCGNFHATTFGALKKDYIDTGKIRFIYRDFPLDPLAMGAAMLARCAPDDKYFAFLSLLYEQQKTWAYSDKPAEALLAIAKQVGFTQESFEACLTNQELLDGLTSVRQRAADNFGVKSTPTFFINGEIFRGARTIEEFAEKLDPHLD